jgi:3-dehydroquinate synthase
VAGLVASLYMRGIPLMHVPTTLLAQVDSSVGGKTGVNLPEGKNLLGTFYPPDRVWTCPHFLRTLPPRRLREGLAEVLKYGYIRAPELLDKACSLAVDDPCGDIPLMEEILCTSVRVKATIVTEDERESGVRRILNFGHTFGHALEALGQYRGLTHGEAVGIGMHLALGVGASLGITQPGLRKDLEARLRAIGLPATPPPGVAMDDLVDLALRDKKRSARGLHFVFVCAPGETIVKELEPAVLRSIMKKLA